MRTQSCRRLWVLSMATVLALLRAGVLAAPPEEEVLTHVAHTENLTGFNLLVANLYNDDRLLFTLLAVGLTAVTGLVLGLIMDVIVGAIGLNLEKSGTRE